MAGFQLSPGVQIVERDLTAIVPAVATSIGGFAGPFLWGPVEAPTTIATENVLVQRFAKPTDANAQDWFTAANFLSYTSNLIVTRTDAEGQNNAVALSAGTVSGITLTQPGAGFTSTPTVSLSAPDISGGVQATASATLSGAGVTAITLSNAGSGYTSAPTVTFTGGNGTGATASAVLSGAGVTAVSVGAGGTGYSAATVVFSAPNVSGGTNALGTVTLTADAVTAIVITDPGSGYTSAPTATISGDGTGATATATIGTSTITAITIDVAGSGYTSAPSVTLNGGGGTGATVGSVTIGVSTVSTLAIVNAGSGYSTAPTVTISGGGGSGAAGTATITLVSGFKIKNGSDYIANYEDGQALVGEWAAKYPGSMGNSLLVSMADSATFEAWTYKDEFDSTPNTSDYVENAGGSNDELHVIVIDKDGAFTGTRNAVLEKFAFVSKASDAKKSDGTNNYYKDVVNARSSYVWWMDHTTIVASTGSAFGSLALNSTFKSLSSAVTRTLSGGTDDLSPTDGNRQNAWALFADDSQYDVSLLPLGSSNATTSTFVINNVAEVRLDSIAFVSPTDTDSGDILIGSSSEITDAVIAFRNGLPSTSYAVMDSGYKYQYDRYNDKYRWIPLNGDTAGLCARTDYTNDPWFSPAGMNRGQVKNCIKLAFNPDKTARDNLYKAGVNPVVTFQGQGTVLWGDKTLLAKPSAFDRINVRRLFIVLEKAIATAAKFQLFELNDAFTRAQFRNMVEPFLRDVQGRRGVTEFLVRCDESNNTGEVIDRNEFVGDIYIKPSRSINFITLNFIAARSSVNFSEIGG